MSWWEDSVRTYDHVAPAYENWECYQQVEIITTVDDCRDVVQFLMQHDVLGLDMEGINLGANGPICLIQLCTMDEQCYIFDVWSKPELITEGGLVDIFESDEIVKVVHGCINDSAALYFQHDIMLVNVFDTQVAHAVLQYQQYDHPLHRTQNESLNTLCALYNTGTNPLKNKIRKMYKRRQRFWAQRPLTDDMIDYAAFDVFCLVPNLYDCMMNLLDPDFTPLLNQVCEEQVLSQIDPKEVKYRKKIRKREYFRTLSAQSQQFRNQQRNFNNLLNPRPNQTCKEHGVSQIDPKEVKFRKRIQKKEWTLGAQSQQFRNQQQNFNQPPSFQQRGRNKYQYEHRDEYYALPMYNRVDQR